MYPLAALMARHPNRHLVLSTWVFYARFPSLPSQCKGTCVKDSLDQCVCRPADVSSRPTLCAYIRPPCVTRSYDHISTSRRIFGALCLVSQVAAPMMPLGCLSNPQHPGDVSAWCWVAYGQPRPQPRSGFSRSSLPSAATSVIRA